MRTNPTGLRGFKDGLKILYVDDRHIKITSGRLHIVDNPELFDDKIISIDHLTIELGQIEPWHYAYIYLDSNGNGDINSQFPEFDKDRIGYYSGNNRCIGAIFIQDGYIVPFIHLNRADHNYGNYEVMKFDRPLINPYGLDLLADRFILQDHNVRFAWDDKHWIHITSRSPYWGSSLSNCNSRVNSLFQFRSSTYDGYNLLYEPELTISENLQELSSTVQVIKKIPQNLTPYSKNRLWRHTTYPYVFDLLLPTNEAGAGFFRSEHRANDFLEISTIGFALPDYISSNKGHLPLKYSGIFNGFELDQVGCDSVLFTPGTCFLSNPDEILTSHNNISVIIDNPQSQSFYFFYLTSPENTAICSEIEVSQYTPIYYRGIYYKPDYSGDKIKASSSRYLGAVWINNNGCIFDTYDTHTCSVPPSICLNEDNIKVREIITYTHEHFQYYLHDLLNPYLKLDDTKTKCQYSLSLIKYRLLPQSFIDLRYYFQDCLDTTSWGLKFDEIYDTTSVLRFNWEEINAQDYGYTSYHRLFRSECAEFKKDYIHLTELNPDSYVYLDNVNSRNVGLVIDEYELCDDQMFDKYYYLLAHYHTLYFRDPTVCDFTKGRRACQSLIDRHDDIYLDEFEISEYSDPQSIGMTVKDAMNLSLYCAKIEHTPVENAIVDILHIRNKTRGYVDVDVRVRRKPGDCFQFYNATLLEAHYLEYWFDWTKQPSIISNIVDYYSTCQEPEEILTRRDFHILEDRCHPVNIVTATKMKADLNISLILDYCYVPYYIDNDIPYPPEPNFNDTSSLLSNLLWENWNSNYHSNRKIRSEFCRSAANFKEHTSAFCNKLNNQYSIEVFDVSNNMLPLSPFSKDKNIIDSGIYKGPWISKKTDADYTDSCWFALDRFVHADKENDKNVIILIGNNYKPTISNIGTTGYYLYPYPYPYHLFDLVDFANKKAISIFCISYNYFDDLRFISETTYGNYYSTYPSNLPQIYDQLISDLHFYKYRLNIHPTNHDRNQHLLQVRSIKKWRGMSMKTYQTDTWATPCRLELL